MFTGSALLAKVQELQSLGMTRDQILPTLGYVDSERGKLLYTQFYTALIDAKGGPLFVPTVTDELQAEYDLYCDRYGIPAVDAFIKHWSIVDISYFEDAYVGTYSSKQEFIESLCEENAPMPLWISIDYEDSWENLSEDYIWDDDSDAMFLRNW
jgi:hypothetical protein